MSLFSLFLEGSILFLPQSPENRFPIEDDITSLLCERRTTIPLTTNYIVDTQFQILLKMVRSLFITLRLLGEFCVNLILGKLVVIIPS